MLKKKEIPIWAKKGALIWVEVLNKTGEEVIEYLTAVITESDQDTNTLKCQYKPGADSKEV